MRETKIIAVLLGTCACVAASSVTAATIPAGTTLTVTTVSLITRRTAVGRSFEAKIAQDVSVKGNVRIESRNKSFWKSYALLVAILASPEPLAVELDVYCRERTQGPR